MLSLIFLISLFWVFGQVFIIGFKAAWGITKLLFTVLFWPFILIAMVFFGLAYIAIPILAIIGLAILIARKSY